MDDLSFAVDDPDDLIKELAKGPFHFKLKGTGPLNFHLGCGFDRDTDDTLHPDPKQCIEKLLDSFRDMFEETPKKKENPLVPAAPPELAPSELPEDEEVEKCHTVTTCNITVTPP